MAADRLVRHLDGTHHREMTLDASEVDAETMERLLALLPIPNRVEVSETRPDAWRFSCGF